MFFKRNHKIEKNEIPVLSPVDGRIKSLSKVDDPVFAEKMTGDGVAIVPKSSTVLSSIKGKLQVVFETGHAYGIKSDKGPEILIHIGIDTVKLNGDGFNSKVTQGKSIRTLGELATIDLNVLNERAKSSDVIVIATNDSMSEGNWKIDSIVKDGTEVKAGDLLFKIIK